MIFRNYINTFNLKCPSGKRETEAFHWIRKESEIAKYVANLDFNYKNGFVVGFYVPFGWSADEAGNVIERTLLEYNTKFVVIKE